MRRDIVVIGGSAGSLHVLRELVAALPADFPASIFIVQHVGHSSILSQLLDRWGAMPAQDAVSGARTEIGQIYVAPPDRHLLLHDGHVLLTRGPRENLARPAIDPLFRSAACSFGSRVVGVVLSGGLNDGTAGLDAVKRGGGIAVVQDPADAAAPDMPASALRHVEVDHTVTSAGLPDLLFRLAGEPVGATPEIPAEICVEAAIAVQAGDVTRSNEMAGDLSAFTCPECGGPLWELSDPLLRYRCRIGHAFTAEAVSVAHAERIQHRLSELLQAHRQRAAFARRRAAAASAEGRAREAQTLLERASGYTRDAEVTERFIAEWAAI